jgi:hypothetical protein
MSEIAHNEIIVLDHVKSEVEAVGRKTLDQHNTAELELLRAVDNKEKKLHYI